MERSCGMSLGHRCLLLLQPGICGTVVLRPVCGCARLNEGRSGNAYAAAAKASSLPLARNQRRWATSLYHPPPPTQAKPFTTSTHAHYDNTEKACHCTSLPAQPACPPSLRPKTSKASMRAPYHHHSNSAPRWASSTTSPRARLLVLLAVMAVVGLVYKATTSAPSPSPSSLLQVCVHAACPLPLPPAKCLIVRLTLPSFHSTLHNLAEISPQFSARRGLSPPQARTFLRDTVADRAGESLGWVRCRGGGGLWMSVWCVCFRFAFPFFPPFPCVHFPEREASFMFYVLHAL